MAAADIDYSVLYVPVGGGLAAIIIGIALRMWVSRRAFYRRNAAGVEEFNSYSAKVFSGMLETLVSLVGIASMIGGVIWIMYGLNKH